MPKQKKQAAGAPAWMVTFADLMSLLVCFFVLIISFSIQDTVKLQVVAGSMREAFGVTKVRKFAGIVELDGHPERKAAKNVVLLDDPVKVEREYADEDDGYESGSKASGRKDLSESAIEQARFHRAKSNFENAVRSDPFLRESAEQVTIELTEEGLSVVLVDHEGRSMFADDSAVPSERGRGLLLAIAEATKDLPNRVSIEGHDDAEPMSSAGGYTKFELTAERANAARRLMQLGGVKPEQIYQVAGKGDSDPLFPDDPYLAGNRRIEVTLMRAQPALPDDHSL